MDLFFYSDYKGMLKASFLASCSDDIVKIYSQLEHDIIMDMVRRFSRLGKIESYSAWQSKIYKEIGGLKTDVSGFLSLYDNIAAKKIEELFQTSIALADTNDRKMVNIAQKNMSENEKQILESTFAKIEDKAKINKTYNWVSIKHHSDETFQNLKRLTMTVAATSESKFIEQANAAFMKVSSGAFTWEDAFKDAVNSLAKEGVDTVEYTDSGKVIHRSIESAVRSNIMTGINQNASEITLSNCEDLGTDLVEVSAHLGARDQDRDGRSWANHAELQGKVYCLNGEREYVDADGERRFAPNFFSTCGIGEPDGICGINCRHSYYPYFEGTELQYSDGELDEMKENLVPYVNSKGEETEITQYEAEQMLRYCERNIRNYKRQADAFSESGFGDTPESYQARAKVGEWQQKARNIVEQTGIRRDYTREYIGTTSGKQPRAASSIGSPLEYHDDKWVFVPTKEEKKRYDRHASQHFINDENHLAGITKGTPMTFEQADGHSVNPLYDLHNAYSEVCVSGVYTFEARMRGFDAEVLPRFPGNKLDKIAYHPSLAWNENVKYIDTKNYNTVDELVEMIQSTVKNNERYFISGIYKDKPAGHALSVLKENNSMKYYEVLEGNDLSVEGFKLIMNQFKIGNQGNESIKFFRIDNLSFNPDYVNYIMEKKK